ncbi:hypothetical protein B0H11DRAFT_2257925 [Mycena galericulata]|nr:hypothetical protein B0H11DRAFT_2257925 [Mycena galericulata]
MIGSPARARLFLPAMASSPVHCEVPIHRDPGSEGPVTKYYLVTGINVETPGAYTSWHSANAQYRNVSSASLKGYRPQEWALLLAAWHASCERGEHHPHQESAEATPGRPANSREVAAVAVSPSPARVVAPPATPPRMVARGGHAPDSATSSTQALPTSPHSTPRTRRRDQSPPLRIVAIESRSPSPDVEATLAATAYAVYCAGAGRVFDEYTRAAEYYVGLQRQGLHPVLSIVESLAAAVSVVEEEVLRERLSRTSLRDAEGDSPPPPRYS